MEKTVAEAHPQLYHYTSATGLWGMLEKQQLWATNIAYLNDLEERTGFFNRRLPYLLRATIAAAVHKLNESPATKAYIDKSGGIEAVEQDLGNTLKNELRSHTLRFDEPYTVSFCSPPFDPANGLLSQWRGYGTDGGYAVVFDTAKLSELMNAEQAFHYQHFSFGDVEYFGECGTGAAVHSETLRSEKVIQDAVYKFILSQDKSAFDPTYEPITSLSCRYKHRGFAEEAEVRIVAIPTSNEIYKLARQHDPLPRKEINFRPDNGVLVPYIKLFGHEQGHDLGKLPIMRIIVGPHPDKERRQKAVMLLLDRYGIEAEVIISGIPYRGR